MPKAYSDDLRLRAVWLHVFLGYNIEDTSGMLAMSPSSVKRFKKNLCARVKLWPRKLEDLWIWLECTRVRSS